MHRKIAVAVVWLSVAVLILSSAGVANAQNVKVACIGDSITALPSSWCGDLATKLGAGYTVSNFGVSGTNLAKGINQPYWTSAQYTPSHTFAPDIVIIMLGTNDAFPSSWSNAKTHFVADYEELLGTYTSIASKPKPYIIIPTPIGTSPFGHDGNLIATEVIPLIKEVAVNKMVPTIDAFTLFGGSMFDAGLYGGSDQVHPNAKGQQMICDEVYKVLTSTGALGGSGGAGGAGAVGSGGAAGSGGATSAGGTAGGSSGAPGANAGGATGVVTAGSGGTTGGAGGFGGSMNASGAATGASTTTFGGASAAGGTSSAGVAGSPATGGTASSSTTPIGAAGMSGPIATTSQSDGAGCRISGNFKSKHPPMAMLVLLLGSVLIRSRKRSGRRRAAAEPAASDIPS